MACARFHFYNSNTNSNSNTVNWNIHCTHKFSGIIFAIGSKHFCQFGRTNGVVLLWRTSTLLQRILHHSLMLPMLPESLLDDFATFDFVFDTTWPCDIWYYLAMWPCRNAAWVVVNLQMLQSNPFDFFTSFFTPPYLFTSLLPAGSCTLSFALGCFAVLNLEERGW